MAHFAFARRPTTAPNVIERRANKRLFLVLSSPLPTQTDNNKRAPWPGQDGADDREGRTGRANAAWPLPNHSGHAGRTSSSIGCKNLALNRSDGAPIGPAGQSRLLAGPARPGPDCLASLTFASPVRVVFLFSRPLDWAGRVVANFQHRRRARWTRRRDSTRNEARRQAADDRHNAAASAAPLADPAYRCDPAVFLFAPRPLLPRATGRLLMVASPQLRRCKQKLTGQLERPFHLRTRSLAVSFRS